jgi:hypothetical protein
MNSRRLMVVTKPPGTCIVAVLTNVEEGLGTPNAKRRPPVLVSRRGRVSES